MFYIINKITYRICNQILLTVFILSITICNQIHVHQLSYYRIIMLVVRTNVHVFIFSLNKKVDFLSIRNWNFHFSPPGYINKLQNLWCGDRARTEVKKQRRNNDFRLYVPLFLFYVLFLNIFLFYVLFPTLCT